MTTVALDVMGGDNCPDINIDGAFDALNNISSLRLKLVGPEAVITDKISGWSDELKKRIDIVDAPSVIGTDESPVKAISKKKDSSIVTGVSLVKNKKADAFISAGSTGAILAAGQLIVGRLPVVLRSPLATMIPTKNGFSLFLDCGANVDAKPEWLVQYARMGSIYMDKVQERPNASVKLVNLGTEEEKGNALTKAVHPMLSELKDINYQGYIESRDVPYGGADIIVADAFTGNAIIKTFEGTAGVLISIIKDVLKSSPVTKLAALLIMKPLKQRLKSFDAAKCGGAILLGLKGVIIKCHGNANRLEISTAIEKAVKYIDEDVNGLIETTLNEENT